MFLVKLPKTVEYEIKVLICLAHSGTAPVSAEVVAKRLRIPPAQTAKTLHLLARAGLVRSRRGPRGGYVLAEDPEELRLEQVLKLFWPNLSREAEESADPLLQIWTGMVAEYERKWERLTIAELARRTATRWESICGGNEPATAGLVGAGNAGNADCIAD